MTFDYKEKILELCKNKQVVFIYHSLEDELDTKETIDELLKNKTVVLPMCEENSKLICQIIESRFDLDEGRYGIMEPKQYCKIVDKENIDIFFVPGAAFDLKGNRKGRGEGYFDRFLKDVKKPIIGMGFDKNVKKEILAQFWDVPVQYILTEKRYIECKK